MPLPTSIANKKDWQAPHLEIFSGYKTASGLEGPAHETTDTACAPGNLLT